MLFKTVPKHSAIPQPTHDQERSIGRGGQKGGLLILVEWPHNSIKSKEIRLLRRCGHMYHGGGRVSGWREA